MTFRYLLVDTSGDVTGTNDTPPDISDLSDIICIIDTTSSTYTNDDLDDTAIKQYEPEDDDGDDDGE